MRARRPQLSLLGRFSLMSLAVIVVLGFAIATVLKGQIESRALHNAEQLATATAALAVEPRLRTINLATPLTRERVSELDTDLGARPLKDAGLVRLKLFNRSGRLAYSDDRRQIGEDESNSAKVRGALAGRVVSEVQHGVDDTGSGRQVLEVYAPLRIGDGPALDGALEIYLSYDTVAATIARDTRILYLLLAGGLGLLYAALFRIVAKASRRLRDLALRDGLTGLANRTLFGERVERAIPALAPGRLAAVLLIDLDRFKEVNDTLGHNQGDDLLKEVSERLSGALRPDDTLARLGGDEFAVLLADLPNRGAAAELAGRLHDVLRLPFTLRGIAVELDASIGIAFCPEQGADVTTLMQRADVAMYEAKRAQGGIEAYSADRDPYSPDRLGLLGELRRAIDGGELVLHYQPKIALPSGEVTGVEALVRWEHPQRGQLQPGDFVPLAERTGTIAHLTRWVLDEALRQCAEWRAHGVELPIAVNLAAANVVDPALPNMVGGLLARHDVPGHLLDCEVSEHTVMSDPTRVSAVLGGLRRLGVRLSLDDFGTGQSSLGHLKKLPLDEVKIDRSFVTGMAEDEGDAVIVRSTIDLARNLGLTVVAEGIETEEVLKELVDLHCGSAQGFYISRPLPPAELFAWLGARHAASHATSYGDES